jgi:hypothetical protein
MKIKGDCGIRTNSLRVVLAAGVMMLTLNSASAISYDVSGSNLLGAVLTGTLEADYPLTNITSIDLSIGGNNLGGSFSFTAPHTMEYPLH